MNRNSTLDVIRLFGAFFVVLIHSQMGSLSAPLTEFLKLLGRWAVPFYFLVSGYFLGKKYCKSGKFDLKSLKKIFGIYLIANLVFLPIVIIKQKLLNEAVFTSPFHFFLYGSYWHLWFLNSLIVGFLTLWYFISRANLVLLKKISIFLIIISLLTNCYFLLFKIKTPFEFFRTFISIPLIYIGFEVYRRRIAERVSLAHSVFLIIAGVIIQYMEGLFFFYKFNYSLSSQQFLIGTFFSGLGIFLLGLNLITKPNVLSNYGEKYSLFIYIYHPLVILFGNFGVTRFFTDSGNIILWFSPIYTFIFSLLFGIICDKYLPKLFRTLNGDFIISKS